MSRQINFYAAPADTARIHQWLLAEFPGLTLVSQRRGPAEHMVPVDASAECAFWRYPVSLLVPAWAKPRLAAKYLGDRFANEFIISAHDSPVIEYHPCLWDEENQIATASRFYWAYAGELPAEALRQVNKLLRWVQRSTVAVPGPFFRFFPDAAQTARFVREHPSDKPKENPLFQAHGIKAPATNR